MMNKRPASLHSAVPVLAAVVGLLYAQAAQAQSAASSTLPLMPGANDWFNAAAWTNGVPNSPGAVAQLQLLAGTTSQVAMSSPVTLEQLLFTGHGSTTLQGGGPLTLLDDGAGELLLQVSAAGGAANATVNVPLAFSANEPLHVDVGLQGTLQLNGTFASVSGDVVKTGVGELRIGGANASWTGGLDVNAGAVVLAHPQALGAASAGATVRSAGRLVFQHTSAEPLTIEGGVVQLANIDFTGPISIVGSALIQRPQNPVTVIRGQQFETTLGPTNVNGSISGDGDLTIRNQSRDSLLLRGDNTYTGRTYIFAGAVTAASATALGDVAEGTTINGGRLTIQAPTAERFRIESGSLLFNAGDFAPADPIVVAGGDVYFPVRDVVGTPIVVDGLSGAIRGMGSVTSFVGGSTGVGNLRVSRLNVDAPLAHQGNLIIENAKLNVANSYTGDTIVADTTDVNHTGAFGQSQNVRVQHSELRLNVLPTGSPHYFVESGILIVPNSTLFLSPITIGGSSDASLRGDAVYEGPITVLQGLRNQLLEGTFNGPISGPGALELGGGPTPVQLNAANALDGPVRVRGGHVYLNHPDGLDLYNTSVSRGTLHINAAANGQVLTNEDFSDRGHVVFEVEQEIEDPWVLNAGTLTAAAPVGMKRLIAIGGTESAQITGGPIHIDDELTSVFNVGVDASIAGAGDIRNLGNQLGVRGNLSAFTGKLIAQRGETVIDQLAANSLTQGEIHIQDEGTLLFNTSNDTDFVVEADIFLHNAHGNRRTYDAALVHNYYASEARFRGRIDVGDQGSTTQGNFTVEGPITGANLTHRGSAIRFTTPQNQLGGVLRLDGGTLMFDNTGRITSVDAISIENGGGIYLNIPGSDRIGDGITVASRGGDFSLFSNGLTPAAETLSVFRPERAVTRLINSSDHGSLSSTLTIEHLERQPGSVLQFMEPGRLSTTRILNQSTQFGGMLGPWAVIETDFAALDASGRVIALPTSNVSINAATPSDHVRITSAQTLAADATVASLRGMGNTPLDLNGHRLTIASGGMFDGPLISNGTLTAGIAGDAELVLHYAGAIGADIVDNPSGSVALIASDGYVRLSGSNSYTGGTWVVGMGDLTYDSSRGQLTIESYSAIPANDRVHVDHGIYNLQPLPAGTVHLAELHLREGGRITSGLAQIDADQVVLEEGLIYATLVGDGAILKQTDGIVDFSNSKSPDYAGAVTVQDGRLLLQTDTLPKAQFHLEGGHVRFSNSDNVPNHFTLDGGALSGGSLTGVIDVKSDSVLMHEGSTQIAGTLRGGGDLTIRGRQDNRFSFSVGLFGDASQFTGDFHVESGALRIGAPGGAGAADIDVQAAGRLILAANSYTDPTLIVANDVHLYGGTLYSFPPFDNFGSEQASPSVLTGELAVHGEGYIGALRTGIKNGVRSPGLTLAGQVTLDDGAHVFGLSDGRHTIADGSVALVDISGRLLVGVDATWHLLSSSLSISGEIRANAPAAAIDFVGGRQQLRLNGAEFFAGAGQSLAVTVNGGALPMNLVGSGNVLAGEGTLVGDFTVGSAASIAPGASPGILSIDGDATLATGGVLDVELAGAQLGAEYDQLNVLGHMQLDGALLDVTLLGGFVPAPDDAFVVLRADSLSGVFANAASSIQVGNLTLPVTYRNNMVIVGNAAVPEPATVLLLLLAGLALPRDRRKKPLR